MNKHLMTRAGAALLLAATALPAQTELFTLAGDQAGGRLGVGTYVGDVNGDGAADFAVSAPLRDQGGLSNRGRVTLHSGADGSVLWSRDGDVAHERLGTSLAGLHDVNGDGVPDLAVGAPGVAAGTAPGRVLVLSGDDGSLLNELVGSQAGGRFGASVAGTGDLDADGLPELIVGAPDEDHGEIDNGKAYVLDPLSGDEFSSLAGVGASDQFGLAVTGGAGSLVANTQLRYSDNPVPIIGFSDNPTPTIGASQGGTDGRGYALSIDPLDGTVLSTQYGTKSHDRFGSSLTDLGDLDGDGVSELAIGSDPRCSAENPTGEGYVQLLDGADRGLIGEDDGEEWGDNFGVAIAATGDVNGDGVPDYLVGEAGNDAVAEEAGRAVLYSGADRSVLAQVVGTSADAKFGSTLFGVGDLNGDGLTEFAVSAPDESGDRGRVTVYTLTPWAQVGGGTGVAQLSGRGGFVGGEDIELVLEGADALASARVVYGTTLLHAGPENLPTPAPDVILDGFTTDAEGRLSVRLSWPSGVPAGTTTWFQVLVDDGVGGEAASTVISGTTP